MFTGQRGRASLSRKQRFLTPFSAAIEASPAVCYYPNMTHKDLAIETIQKLPDSATWPDIEERIRFLAAIDKGLEDVRAGRVTPHEDIKASLKQWLSK